ncbi:hypothetical protein PSEUBRA_004456 [Kalmanozyma brasiliensis GHG001]|uniref:uncharacterized protein n=1 Tax=Kalmanozyma brasiliensis (strain GHG001) TaxID=1365824 RepID=UPI002867D343|nr:uncharacterized protein PSEUBRA_004456 [Kalmanozyma brasiliensis GHG001]KAF6767382.1 hypothetical protein PSEUBRA_004456 [Kalmanozyma brasiliensis GHG001]
MSRSGSGTFCWVSPRTATLAIAMLGIIIHLNTYSWLGSLSASLPDVPERGSGQAPPASAAFVPSADRFSHSAAKFDRLIDLAAAVDSEGSANKNVYLPEWVAEAKAYLKAQGLSFVPRQGEPHAESLPNPVGSVKAKDVVPDRRFEAPDPTSASFHYLDDGAEDIERMQWHALRLVIRTLRWYILLSVVCCCAGVVGVLRSNLLLSRLFVVHSFLDFLLSTLSLLALAIVCTYPTVRAHVCDEFGSGELQAWLSLPRAAALPQSPSSPTQSSGGAGSPDVTLTAPGWEAMLDGVFASENCEESFRTTLVPLLMAFGLFFTAVRLQCFFLVQRFYATLLRSKVYGYGYASTESGLSTPGEGGRDRIWKESKLRD